MKLRAFLVSALILVSLSTFVVFSWASRPIVEKEALAQALKEKDTPLLIKHIILHMKEQMEINEDQFPELIRELEHYTDSCKDEASVAVLHSMLAEMYQTYYRQNQWTINQRTDLVGYVPQDLREWTANLFVDKVCEELKLSLQPTSLLQATPVSRFDVLLEKGADSEEFRPSLYAFLANRALGLQPSVEVYKELIAFQNQQKNNKAVLLTELAYLRFLYVNPTGKQNLEAYLQALDELYREQSAFPYAAEILIAKLDALSMSRRAFDVAGRDSLLAEEVALCQEGLRRYPKYPRTVILRNQLEGLSQPTLSSSLDNTVYPGKELQLRLEYKNLKQATVQIYKSGYSPLELMNLPANPRRKAEREGKCVQQFTLTLDLPDIYLLHDTVLRIKMEEPGLYFCKVISLDANAKGKELCAKSYFSVSRLATAHRLLADGSAEVRVVDFLTGKPIEHARVQYYGGKRDRLSRLGELLTNREGLASLPANQQILAYQSSLAADQGAQLTPLYMGRADAWSDQEKVELSIFTDRGLYRPGQSVFFKGLAFVRDLERPHVVAGRTFKVVLYDVNGKEVASREMKSNEFGSFHGEFVLPKQTLSGTFRINVERTNAYVQVEEYKRPTFEAVFQPLKEEVAFGDTVVLHGAAKTFSGVSLPAGDVTWRVVRRPFWGGISAHGGAFEQVAEGETELSAQGGFECPFVPRKEEDAGLWHSTYQRYEVIATVTDSKGESQEARYSFSVGDCSFVLSTQLPAQVAREQLNLSIEATTLGGEPIAAMGTYRVVSLVSLDENVGHKNFREGATQLSGSFTAGQRIDPASLRRLPSGRYRLLMEAHDRQGRLCRGTSDFILYGAKDKRPPVFTHSWLVEEQVACLPGEEASFVFGTSDSDAYILYEWFIEGKRVHQETIRLDEANRRFKIPFKVEYGQGLVASFTFLKAGKLYQRSVPITLRLPNRKLAIQPITFRDRLLPGAHERWTFRITDADSTRVSAEVLAGLYDASLDRIVPFNWYFSPERSIHLSAPSFSGGRGLGYEQDTDQAELDFHSVPAYQYDRLDWMGLFFTNFAIRGYRNSNRVLATGGLLMKSAGVLDSAPLAVPDVAVEETMEQEAQLEAESQPAVLSLRQNFAETAFFYPTLRTNEEGDLFVDFTLPESNTTWKLQLLAHTKELKYGQLTREIFSSKPLMVLPNLPRFVRQGDEVSISAQVINHSSANLSGRVRIELFDPATDQPIVCLTKSQRPFELQPDSVTTVSWMVPVPKQISLLGVRILADSEQGSDGEQHLLPVLSNQLLITESTPFYLLKEGERQIHLSGNSAGKTPFRLTLEMTANPIWYAVQALPTIAQPDNNNILSWFAAYYSNTLASYIAQANPRIQAVVRQWMAQGGDASTLYSNLEKNQELKQILLEETPWVLAADNETEQKQRLSLLFDLNRAEGLREAALWHLIEQQSAEGGWSWFKGLPASRSITLSVLKGMAQLVELNAIQYGEAEKEMQIKALRYLDKCIQREYEHLRKSNQSWQKAIPSPEQIDYLFVRSAYRDIPELGDARDAIRFYTSQAEKNWNRYTLHGKGEIALLMHRNGKKEVATAILAWLKKHATTSEEKGMYWANNRRGSDYFTSPIDTHCLLMSLFNDLAPDTLATNRMKQWLLNQKRTQNWESVPATVNAIYALLLTGSDWLNTQDQCVATYEGKTYRTAEGEIATGYLKTILPNEPANSTSNSLFSIRKEGDTPAWGAVYEQYFQDVDQVEGQKGVLNVEKRLFVETNNGTNRQIRPVTPEQPLRIGDKVIVRLTIRTDREMDYVCLKDLRAGCFEPADPVSGMESRDGISYYRSPKDVSENFFINRLPEGTFVLEYPVYVSRSGEYAGGISTIQCMYAPEFVSHTAGERLQVEP